MLAAEFDTPLTAQDDSHEEAAHEERRERVRSQVAGQMSLPKEFHLYLCPQVGHPKNHPPLSHL